MRRRVFSGVAGSVIAFVAAACVIGETGDPSQPHEVADGVVGILPAPTATASSGNPLDAAPLDGEAAASCNVRLDAPLLLPAIHVPVGSPVTYDSNPPSSGSHYPIWASFQEYASPVPDGYLVHSMEHGAVVLTYKCDAPCPEIVDVLRAVRKSLPPDPQCSADIGVRVIIAPRPANDDLVAAAAWGFTYRAACADPASLGDFVRAHYAQGPEDFCAPGTTSF